MLLSDFLRRVGADLTARYVGFTCFDDYATSIDMASALHPQTILALDLLGKPLAPEWDASVRLRVPTKLATRAPRMSRELPLPTLTLAATGKSRVTIGFLDHERTPDTKSFALTRCPPDAHPAVTS